MKGITSILFICLLALSPLLQAQCTNDCFIDVTEQYDCDKNTITLEAHSNGTFIGWYENSVLLSNQPVLTTTPINQTITAVAAGTFSNNLIINGDFESGVTNFTSDYDLTAMNDTVFNNGDFNLTPNPSVLSAFVNIQDHTGNGGNMLIADASKFDYKAVVEYKVNVVKGKIYRFAFWGTNIHQDFLTASDPKTLNSAKFGVYIDSTFIQSMSLPKNISWNELTVDWVADTTGTLEIAIKSLNTAKEENDFALDDIQFYALTTVEKSITLAPCADSSTDLDVFSPDGDGHYDTFPITATGTAKIYNIEGFLIQELQAPTSWNGYTNKGEPAAVGYYIIVIDDEFVKKVSLMK